MEIVTNSGDTFNLIACLPMDMAETRQRLGCKDVCVVLADLKIGNSFTIYRYPTFEPECRTSVTGTVQDDDIVIFIICLYYIRILWEIIFTALKRFQ